MGVGTEKVSDGQQRKFDFNRDGLSDGIREGLRYTTRAAVVTLTPYLAGSNGEELPVTGLDWCPFVPDQKIWDKMSANYLWRKPSPLFCDRSGKKCLGAGEQVVHSGQVQEIKAFRIMINNTRTDENFHSVALLPNCVWAEIEDLSPAKPLEQKVRTELVSSYLACATTRPVRYCMPIKNEMTLAEEALTDAFEISGFFFAGASEATEAELIGAITDSLSNGPYGGGIISSLQNNKSICKDVITGFREYLAAAATARSK